MIDADDVGQDLGSPGGLALVDRALGSLQHGLPTTHQLDVALRALPRGQRVQGPGVRLEPAQIADVDLPHGVLDRAVELAEPGMLRQMGR